MLFWAGNLAAGTMGIYVCTCMRLESLRVFEKRHLVAERIKLFSVRYRANIGIFVLLVTPGRFKIRHRQGPSLTVLLMRTPRMTQCVEVRGYFASRHLRPVTDDQLQALDDVVM